MFLVSSSNRSPIAKNPEMAICSRHRLYRVFRHHHRLPRVCTLQEFEFPDYANLLPVTHSDKFSINLKLRTRNPEPETLNLKLHRSSPVSFIEPSVVVYEVSVHPCMRHCRPELLSFKRRPAAFVENIFRRHLPCVRRIDQHKICPITCPDKPSFPDVENLCRMMAHF